MFFYFQQYFKNVIDIFLLIKINYFENYTYTFTTIYDILILIGGKICRHQEI